MSYLYQPKKTDFYWLEYHVNGKRYRESLKTKDKTAAKYLQAKKDQKIAEGMSPLPKLNSVCLDVLEEYQKATEHHKAKDNHRDDAARIRRFLQWASVYRLSDITEKTLQDYLNYRLNDEKNKIFLTTANNITTNVKTWLNFAVRRKYLIENPLRFFQKYKVPKNPPRFLTKDEIVIFMTHAKKESIYPMIATAIYAGLRQAELSNLELGNMDLKRCVITVQNSEAFTTKSKKYRVVPIHPALKAILKPLAKKQGRCFDTTNQRKQFERICRLSKLTGIRWHTLRHTFASHLIMQGVDLVTVSEYLGHASITTTMIYAHLSEGHKQNQIRRLPY